MKNIKITVLLAVLLLCRSWLFADVSLPSIISSNMVLQQNTQAPLWGWADAGEKISISASWLNNNITTVANPQGEWMVKLRTPTAGGPYKIIINGNNSIVLDNILSGEVWFASGQSNMAMAVEKCNNADEEIATANYPNIRLFHVTRKWADKPQQDCDGYWAETTPETIKKFSGVAYFFGRKLYNELNVPIGIISASKGGSPIESWMAEEVLKSDPDFDAIFEMWKKWEAEYPEVNKKYQKELALWQKQKDANQGQVLAKIPARPMAVHQINRPHKRPSHNYNGMVAPIIPFAIKGVIWYQGESNVNRPTQYIKLFQTMITSWRKGWGEGNFPFYFVQIAPYRYKKSLVNASLLREAQTKALSLPNTGIIVTTDVGNIEDIHPKNKQAVGSRLALLALAKTYKFDNLVYTSPVYKLMKIEGNAIRLSFDNIGSGLTSKEELLTDFEIAGADQKFVKATAIIDGATVVVSSDKVTNPVAVRFGWSIISEPNFFNKEGFPAAPFRTDNWE